MFVDSHCHLDFPDLIKDIDQVLKTMQEHQVTHALCVSVDIESFPSVLALADQYPHLFASVGVHPGYPDAKEPTFAELTQLALAPKVVAIGETGLDYYHDPKLGFDPKWGEWQRERFRTHIQVSHAVNKPLIIHTREASEATLKIMREEKADKIGGVIHCFTETMAMAKAVLEMGFYISFSGIVTFKNAADLRAVAQYVPLDRLLIETDSPYLAPVPFRGKTNQPAFVSYVAQCIAEVKGIPVQKVGEITSHNFFTLFSSARKNDES